MMPVNLSVLLSGRLILTVAACAATSRAFEIEANKVEFGRILQGFFLSSRGDLHSNVGVVSIQADRGLQLLCVER